jgi:predicted cobalt transporter CbtA
MIVRLLLAALAAGLIAGLAMTPAQYVKTIPLIMQAEAYENGGAWPSSHDAPLGARPAMTHGADESSSGFGRLGDTIVANLVAGGGFALMLAAVALLLTGVEFPAGTAGVTRGCCWVPVPGSASSSRPRSACRRRCPVSPMRISEIARPGG